MSISKDVLKFLAYRGAVALCIYGVAGLLYKSLLDEDDWYLEAVVPTTAFLISTLGPKALRKLWGAER